MEETRKGYYFVRRVPSLRFNEMGIETKKEHSEGNEVHQEKSHVR